MSFFAQLLESIGLRKREAHVGLRPHRDVVLAVGIEVTHERALDALARVLGANVYVDDRLTHTIEAGFGTLNQERIRVSLVSESVVETRVHIEAYFPAGVERPKHSLAVDTLAGALSSRA